MRANLLDQLLLKTIRLVPRGIAVAILVGLHDFAILFLKFVYFNGFYFVILGF